MQHHLDQAKENLEVLVKLESNFPHEHFDWKTTVIFYTAVHLTRAILAKRSLLIHTHSEAKIHLKKILNTGAYRYYVQIENYADASRYLGVTPNKTVWLDNRQSDYLHAKDMLGKLQTQLMVHIK